MLSDIASEIDSNILIKSTFSTDIFPSIVSIGESKYLLWDMHFWKIFDALFKTNYLYFVDDVEKYGLTIEKIAAYITMIYKYYFLDVLTCRLENQYLLAYRTAQEEFFVRELMIRYPEYQLSYSFNKKNSNDIEEIILYSKLFVMLYEVHHCYFEKDRQFYMTCVEYYQKIADVFLNETDLSNISIDKKIIDILRKGSYKNTENIEEAICDFHAFRLAYKFLAKSFLFIPRKDIAENLYCAFCPVVQLVCSLESCTNFWKECAYKFDQYYKNKEIDIHDLYDNVNQYNEKMHNRLSLLKLVIAVDLYKSNEIQKSVFDKGDKMAKIIGEYAAVFFDYKYLATIHHESINLKVANQSKNFILDAISLLTGALYE